MIRSVGAVLPAQPRGTPMADLIGGQQYIALTLQGGQMVALALSRATTAGSAQR